MRPGLVQVRGWVPAQAQRPVPAGEVPEHAHDGADYGLAAIEKWPLANIMYQTHRNLLFAQRVDEAGEVSQVAVAVEVAPIPNTQPPTPGGGGAGGPA